MHIVRMFCARLVFIAFGYVLQLIIVIFKGVRLCTIRAFDDYLCINNDEGRLLIGRKEGSKCLLPSRVISFVSTRIPPLYTISK